MCELPNEDIPVRKGCASGPLRDEQLRKVVQDYIDDLKELIRKLRTKH
ncbi:hypothetical protein [Bradyrhizobium japonicum]|nr:hypothetical protein [Bradyrhizobium japonicum]